MDAGKMDAALAAALARESGAGAVAGGGREEPQLSVTVKMATPLTEAQVSEVAGLGVCADTRRTIFSAQLGAKQLGELAAKRCVARISLAQPLRPLRKP